MADRLQVQETCLAGSGVPKEGDSLSRHAHRSDYRIDPDTGCWLWLKTLNRKGYGTGAFPDQGTQYAHRAYWIAANGPVPEGRHIVIDHLCRNPRCVNPEHLEAVEQATNMHRGKGAKLTMDIAREVRRMVQAGHSNAYITAQTGVTTQNIWWIAEDLAWREDPTAPRRPVFPERDCPYCGERVPPERGRRARFCTTEHRLAAKREKAKAA